MTCHELPPNVRFATAPTQNSDIPDNGLCGSQSDSKRLAIPGHVITPTPTHHRVSVRL